MFENYSASCYIWIFHTCVDTCMAPCHDMSSAGLVYSIMPSESKIRYYPTGSTLNHSAPGGGGLKGTLGPGTSPYLLVPWDDLFSLWSTNQECIVYIVGNYLSHNGVQIHTDLYLENQMDLELGLCMTKNLLSQPFGCVGGGSSRISIPMAWISFGNCVHFPLFFTSSLNISQTYFGKIVLTMIETVRPLPAVWAGFYKKQMSKETFWFHFPCTSFQNSKRFWSLAAFPCCPQATQKERSEQYIWYCTSCDFLQRPMLQEIWANSHPCIIFLTLFSLTFWPAGLRALVLRIKQICKTEIQRAS